LIVGATQQYKYTKKFAKFTKTIIFTLNNKKMLKGNDIIGMEAIKELKEHLLSMDKFVKKSNGSDDFLYQLESEIQKAMDIILPISLEQEQAVIKTPDPIEPKHEFSLAELYKLKTFN
jgi:hypothetical protein